MPSISHMLWFDSQAEEAANFYVNIFPDGKVTNVAKGPDGKAFSIFVNVDGQEEVDKYWDALLADGGEPSQCGWLKDKFGVSWQIVPKQLGECLGNPDPEKSGYAMQAMMKMSKIVIADLTK